ncbi:RanBP1 domain protein [Necator americanus]|uniref:RanBP1 domain protein n=1 Tax=Necator americanus TaxID=51031 RepID=W2TIE0_NECAM|nr:RanBP1 domain protein [Necator americanus]ETN80936.1 RanBP1 domain protein [Necator americanus]
MSKQPDSDSGAPAKKMFAFRQSALSAKADQLWNQSKSGFGFGVTPSTHVQLEKKSLDDVLGRMAAEKKLRQEREEKGQPVFVFGSKISDRVIQEAPAESSNGNASVGGELEGSRPKTAEELFKSAAQQDKAPEEHDFIAEAKEAAEKKKEHEKPSTSLVAIMTGEENDINIFQTACKLHSFDTEKKTWVERGLSQIRINQRNEDGEVHHRIVARTTGNHRVVINSKVHADMLFERVDAKRFKISATSPDSNGMQIFLVTIGFSASGDPGAEKVAKMKIQEDGNESQHEKSSPDQKLQENSSPSEAIARNEKEEGEEDLKSEEKREDNTHNIQHASALSE